MRITIATPILYNPTSPFNHIFKDIIGGFLDAGYEVERHVAVRDDNEDEFKYGYTGERIHYKKYIRKESEHGNIISRFLRDSFTTIKEAKGIRKTCADVLFEDVSYSSFWVVRAAKKKGMRVVAMLQDVWPDNAVQSGLIKQGGLLYRFFELWQRYVYKKADKIICISDDMKDFIAGKGVGEDKIEVIYNWGYSDEMVDISWDDNAFVKKYRLNRDMFYAIYAGNIGKMQNVEIVVNAAKVLQDRSNIQFLIIGDGVRKKQIQEMANGLKNITMLPMQPAELATHIYSAASVNLIPLVAGGTKTAMPSKTGVVLACNKPVIFTFGKNAKFNNLLVSYNVGCSVDPDDEKALATEIERIYQTKTQLPSMSKSSEFLKDIFSRSKNKEKYVFALRDTCNV